MTARTRSRSLSWCVPFVGVTAALAHCAAPPGHDDAARAADVRDATSPDGARADVPPTDVVATPDAAFDGAPSDVVFDGTPGPTSPLTFTPIAATDPDLVAPGRGVEQWHDQNQVNVPIEGTDTTRTDDYWRFPWSDLQTGSSTYDWSAFDAALQTAIAHRQRFSFGIMTVCPSCDSGIPVGGAPMMYPRFVHDAMQAEAVHDWITPISGKWVPNWNSEAFLAAGEGFLRALSDHIAGGTSAGVHYADAIGYVDIRFYGSWGEWHCGSLVNTFADFPAGTAPTAASLNRIIDAHLTAFPHAPQVINVSAYDAMYLPNTMVPLATTYHALTASNAAGLIGFRSDHWGIDTDYYSAWLENNDRSYMGMVFGPVIMDRWKYAPVVGEPPGYTADGACEYDALVAEIRRYHATSFGNGNYASTSRSCMRDNIRAGARAAGYRLVLTGGSATTRLGTDRALAVALDWQNVGLAPPYFHWNVAFELRASGGAVAWTAVSSFDPRLFLPAASPTHVADRFAVPASVASGSYALHMTVRDPVGYAATLPLAIQGRQADGSYVLGTVVVP